MQAKAVSGLRTEHYAPLRDGVNGCLAQQPDGRLMVLRRNATGAVLRMLEAISRSEKKDTHVLARLGVDRALARHGARDGDLVHIGSFTFEYRS